MLVYGIDFYYVVILRRLVFPWFADATFRKALYNENEISEGIIKAGGHLIKLQNGNYKTYDGSHTDRPSAEKLSLRIAREIQSHLTE